MVPLAPKAWGAWALPPARMYAEMVCSWERSQGAWDSYLASSGYLQARGAGSLLSDSSSPSREMVKGHPAWSQMRKPGNQGPESPHEPARGSCRCAALRASKRERWAWVGSRVAVSQEVGTSSSCSLGLTGPSAKKPS